MGENKALLAWRGGRLIDFVANTVRDAGVSDVFVSGDVSGYECIPDRTLHQGAVGGICASVEKLHPYTQILFLPVDMPLLSVDCLQKLLDAQNTCHFENNPLPILLNITPEIIAYTARITEPISMKKYLRGLQTVELPVSPEIAKALTNTNTPEEWRKANEYTN